MTLAAAASLVRLVDGSAVDDAALAAYLPWLSEGETLRYGRFVRRERRRQFVIGRVLLRQMLGELLGVAPHAVLLEEREGKAPRLLAPADQHAGFSISHSGPWVACALNPGMALGLDIELIDPARDIDALASQAFDAAQCAWLAARPPETRLRDFYRLWSEQEARFKLGVAPGPCVELAHPALSIVLCGARPQGAPPQLLAGALAPA